jgi:glutamate-1-semialdehyde 2,1-aminomutase
MAIDIPTVLSLALGAIGVTYSAAWVKSRLELSKAKHASLAGHSRLSRRLAALVPAYSYDESRFFTADGAPAAVAAERRADFDRLAALYRGRFPKTVALTKEAATVISDMQFTAAYRVPFRFSPMVRKHLPTGSFLAGSAGVTVTDLDGNTFHDLAGSYGVNLLGYDFYKACAAEALETMHGLGPVLGAYHPVVADNAARLARLSGMDEVSFHMSGTEAVMQAVRLARYHTRRSHLVRFCGAYHGWWGDVQPGVGNPVRAHETYTLRDMCEETLRVLARRRDIACVLVNPIQAQHPNAGPPADGALVDSSRQAGFDRAAYADWLKRLRDVCTERGIVLIFDEVFVGFRLAPGGAQEYFGVRADLVTYGKTLGGGLPIGVVCGRRELMRRYRDDRPADICLARGTFNAHPQVMAAMNAFLRHFEAPAVRALYQDLDATWNRRAGELNCRLEALGLPVRVSAMSTIWIVRYTEPSAYNWMLQYYLRAEGVALSWVGTGRIIFSLNYTETDFAAVADKFVAAAEAMLRGGWWWRDARTTNRSIRRQILREMMAHRLAGFWHRSPAAQR